MIEQNPQTNGADYQQQISELNGTLSSVLTRLESLEAVIKSDHATLVEDHRKIESMELTGKVPVPPPVGL